MSEPCLVAGRLSVNEYDPFACTVTDPLGCVTPYSSITLKLALMIPLRASVAFPEIVTETGCGLFGAVEGFAEAETIGATVSILTAGEVNVALFPALSVTVTF